MGYTSPWSWNTAVDDDGDLAIVAARDGVAASGRSNRSRRPAAGVHLETSIARRGETRWKGQGERPPEAAVVSFPHLPLVPLLPGRLDLESGRREERERNLAEYL